MVDEWAGFVREEFPAAARDLNIAVFADGQRQGYSVTAEVFPARMDEVTRLASDAWDMLFTLGKTPTTSLVDVAEAIDDCSERERRPEPGTAGTRDAGGG